MVSPTRRGKVMLALTMCAVYNIIMDFVFAMFPWLITRSLKINRKEKIGLCATMSLGMMYVPAMLPTTRLG